MINSKLFKYYLNYISEDKQLNQINSHKNVILKWRATKREQPSIAFKLDISPLFIFNIIKSIKVCFEKFKDNIIKRNK